ncbi:MAG TPA: type I-E CRISPR-associated protein Cse2/CasB [Sedimentisphaerales bacterium]|nr:type I-E CRISPR-associated protein Cse2/CasB [Sedimentisphaerales bacterium]HRS13102.1 type I-E CRISPR-associated protein Cse2/CasB [Sedimentisphaerales bacterium]HRV46402.1 type I-E CRISPR-associated protein Cse2/CasB [Sedimentisphaerales bacterium]
MTPTIEFINRLENLKEGDRSRLRWLAGQPLDKTLSGFDLFTGLWWPLRATNARTPRREISWLIAKLYCASSVPYVRPESDVGVSLPAVLGRCEPCDPPDYRARNTFRRRFDAVICSSLSDIEPRLQWGLREVAKAVAGRVVHAETVTGIDWALLLDDLSLWDREFNMDDTWQKSRLNAHQRLARCRETHRTPQDLWACEYLNATVQPQGGDYAD